MRFFAATAAAVTLAVLAVARAPAAAGPLGDDGAAACAGESFTVTHAARGAAPYIRLTADGKAGAFLIDWGSTASSLAAEAFGAPQDSLKIVRFSLPSFPTGAFAVRPQGADAGPRGRRIGLIGTDFLAKMSAHIGYGLLRDTIKLGEGPCDAAALGRAGFRRIAQSGYFSHTGARPDRANVPVLPIRIGAAETMAQIDSGYDDTLLKHSIDINAAFYDRLVAAGVKLKRGTDIQVKTCSGVERRQVFTVPATPLDIGASGSEPAVRTVRRFHLLLKPKNGCGGIADMSEPAAQLGASFLRTLSPLVIDGKAEAVWVRP